jgi:hypothetical protein
MDVAPSRQPVCAIREVSRYAAVATDRRWLRRWRWRRRRRWWRWCICLAAVEWECAEPFASQRGELRDILASMRLNPTENVPPHLPARQHGEVHRTVRSVFSELWRDHVVRSEHHLIL